MDLARDRKALRLGGTEAVDRRVPRPSRARPIARSPHAIAINGRFLSQQTTGVQRYAREIVRAIDGIAADGSLDVELLVPAGASFGAPLAAVRTTALGPGSGHAWEQGRLALHRRPTLNLCNTAPVLGRNRVVCIHDANVFDAPSSYGSRFRMFYRLLQPVVARTASVVTTVSRHSAGRIARHLNIPPERIVVAGNGHEHALRWEPGRSTLPPGDRPYVLLIGSLAKHKNVDRILDLASRLDANGIDVKVAGGFARAFKPSPSRFFSNVSFLGTVSDDDLAFLLKNALCLAFPSLSEGFGIPLLEAMVWGCPVIASGVSSLPEVGGDACLYADPNRDEPWMEHILSLRDSPALRDALGVRGRARATRFSWVRSAQLYVELMTDPSRKQAWTR